MPKMSIDEILESSGKNVSAAVGISLLDAKKLKSAARYHERFEDAESIEDAIRETGLSPFTIHNYISVLRRFGFNSNGSLVESCKDASSSEKWINGKTGDIVRFLEEHPSGEYALGDLLCEAGVPSDYYPNVDDALNSGYVWFSYIERRAEGGEILYSLHPKVCEVFGRQPAGTEAQ